MAKDKRKGKLPRFIETQKLRAKRDVTNWQSALRQAESIDNPNRIQLYNIYDDILLDAHLTSQIQKRVEAVKGTGFNLVNSEGEIDPDRTKLIEAPWFIRFLELAMDSRFWGHSLVDISELDPEGNIDRAILVPRRHVIPEFGLFVIKQGDTSGIYYREDKAVVNWTVEVGDPKDLGLLNKAVPHVLYKRFAQGAWAEFCEIFGMPVRVGKTNSRDENARNVMANMLADMGTAAYAVIDEDEEIEFLQTPVSKGDVYNGLMTFSNAEVSKLINGAVTGEASQGGSRSKEEVGQDIQDDLTIADLQWLEGVINKALIPRLVKIGYDISGYVFRFEEVEDLASLWTRTKDALEHYDVPEDFIERKFGIPVTKKKEQASGGPAQGFFA